MYYVYLDSITPQNYNLLAENRKGGWQDSLQATAFFENTCIGWIKVINDNVLNVTWKKKIKQYF